MNRKALPLAVSALILTGVATPANADESTPIQTPSSSSPAPAPAPPETAPGPPPGTPPVINSVLPLAKGAQGWRVKDVQERLRWLGYEISPKDLRLRRMWPSTMAAVRAFQTKNGMKPTGVVGPVTWDRLRTVSRPMGRLPAACMEVTSLCVDKSQRLVRYVVDGHVTRTLDARFGFIGNETQEGTYRVFDKDRDHTSSLYRTWMPYAMFFNGGAAIHYSPYFARDGYNGGSHGCVNLRDFDQARWLFDHVPIGTRVHIYRS